jgi:hypothetical protein
VDGYGSGVEGANVIVDGQLRAVTDNLGHYRLDQVYCTVFFYEVIWKYIC